MNVQALAGLFDAPSRLYRLQGEGAIGSLYAEGWVAREALSALGELRIVALSADASIDLDDLVSRPVSLATVLADGSTGKRSGLIREAELLGGDSGLARYRLTVVPWFWLATQRRQSRLFENTAVLDIVARVLSAYSPYAYELTGDVQGAVADLPIRATTTQYRESDYGFVSRLLAESGLGWLCAENDKVNGGHVVRIFADSRGLPEDASSAGAGVRFQRAGATETQDSVQVFGRRRRRTIDRVTLLGWHAGGKRAVAGEALGAAGVDGAGEAGGIEHYDVLGHDAFGRETEATRSAKLVMESAAARAEVFIGEASVRTFASGTRYTLKDMSPLGPADEEGFEPTFVLDRVEHVGINNLPAETQASLAQRLGGLDAWLVFDEAPGAPGAEPDALGVIGNDEAGGETLSGETGAQPAASVLARAKAVGYANRFESVRCDRPWRAAILDARGARLFGASTATGVHSAIVVSEEGKTSPEGAREIHRSGRGDIRVRFHWQEDGEGQAHSRWARVAQRHAGAGMGTSFVPRIGQEVLVRFMDDDIDQPIVVGALYNGRGEGGVALTPGGRQTQEADTSGFQNARDTRPSAQANLAGGQAPVWHAAGAAESDHRNAGALSGFKTKEFGGDGYNQAVFDDSDGQLRTQFKTSESATELNLGHLIHQAGNYRGGVRGVGAELRTDAYGAVRGGAGVLISSYRLGEDDGVGDLTAGQALARQAQVQGKTLDGATATHEGVRLASAAGGERADVSVLDSKSAPLGGLTRTVSGVVAGTSLDQAKSDAAAKTTQLSDGKVPHLSDPVIAVAAKAGLAQIAGQHQQWVSGETVHWGSGEAVNLAVLGKWRAHANQAIGVVAGLTGAGAGGMGLQIISGEADVNLQAQADTLEVKARQGVTIGSKEGSVEWAAPKRIRIAVAGGASIVLEGGNITVTAPGRIDVKSGNKQFSGPDRLNYPVPAFAASPSEPVKFGLRLQDMPGTRGFAPEGEPWHVVMVDAGAAAPGEAGRTNPAVFDRGAWEEVLATGATPKDGQLALTEAQQRDIQARVVSNPGRVMLISGLTAMPLTPARWSAPPEQAVPEKILDALNFAPDGRNLDDTRSGWLGEVASRDADVLGVHPLKPKTDA